MVFAISSLLFAAICLLIGIDPGKMSFFPWVLQHNTFSLISLETHPYSQIAAFGLTLAGALGLIYGFNVSTGKEQFLSIIAIASAIGVSFAGNFLTFLFFWEALTISTSLLIFSGETQRAVKMAYRVLFLQLIGGFSLTVGIMLNYFATESLAVGYPVAGLPFFLVGIGLKTAILFLHFWVPWGYPEASFPSSVLLAALCTKVGVYALARVIPPGENIALWGACMSIVAVTFALMQSDMRRLLSFHIVSQVGYMVAGVGLGAHLAVDGGLLHLLNNMMYKTLLFMSAGAVLYATGTENLHELHHPEEDKKGSALWKVMPVVAAGTVVGALAIAGTPLFNGYVSKYLLKNAVYGVSPVETLLLVAGVGTTISFCKFVYFGFLTARARTNRQPDFPMQASIAVTAFLCILFGVAPGLMSAIIPHGSYLSVYSSAGILASLQIIGIGIILFIILAKFMEKIHFPPWFNTDHLIFTPLYKGAIYIYTFIGNFIEKNVDFAIVKGPGASYIVSREALNLEEHLAPKLGSMIIKETAGIRDYIHSTWINILEKTKDFIRNILIKGFKTVIQIDNKPKEGTFLSLANFDINFIIIVLTLIVVIGVTFILS